MWALAARAALPMRWARAGATASPDAQKLASAARESVRTPPLLNRVATVANDIISRLQGKIDRKLAIQIATEMLDPQAAANAIEKAMRNQMRAAKVGEAGAAAARLAGKGLQSPVVLAGERTQNAMNEFNYPQ